MTLLVAWPAAVAFLGWLAVVLLPSRPYSTRERLELEASPVLDGAAGLSRISVLIPARNEADAIAGTLSALAAQGGELEVFMIDDQSEDGTVATARSAAVANGLRLRLIEGRPLPEGWGGKLWALEQGLAMVDREYCLLLDAEILLRPGLVSALLHKAESEGRAMVSIMAKLHCESFWEKLLVPPFIFFFKLLYPFAKVNGPGRRAAAAGGCVLIRTEDLRTVGGFDAIRDALIDDCTLAARVKRTGQSIWLGLSESVVSARAYPTLASFRRMVARTAFTQLACSGVLLVLVGLIMLTMFVAPWAAILYPAGPGQFVAGAGGVLLMAMIYWPTVRFYGLPVAWAFSLPVAAMLFLAMTIESAVNYWRGTRAQWKGRRYAVR